jgi:GDP-L-fucose synthase
MNKADRIFVAGHRGLVGSACVRMLQAQGYKNLLMRSRSELDLRDAVAVRAFFSSTRPDYVILAAAKVGGIGANARYPVEFLLDNLSVQNSVIPAAHEFGVKKLLFLGSSCIYPKFAPQPIPESALLSGPLEPTNDAYAIAKIAGIKLCEAYRREYDAPFISAMPTNLYGQGDNFDLENSHVLPALIRRFHEAREAGRPEVVLWGTGSARREFLYSDDLACACIHLLNHYVSPDIINIGCGQDLTIRELAETIQEIVGFSGDIVWDATKPDGTPRKLLNVEKLFNLGWKPRVPLREGIRLAYDWWLSTSSLAG